MTRVKAAPKSVPSAPSSSQRTAWSARTVVICALLVISVIAVFGQVASFEFIRFDDPAYLLKTPHVRNGLVWRSIRWAFCETQVANWHPLTILSYLIDSQLWGFRPGPFHITNLVLHVLNTLLLFWVLRRLTGAEIKSALVAALFGLHPLHVESVAWVAERKDVLSTFFMLLTIWAYAAWVDARTWRRYAVLIGLYALGLMSKPMLVTLPFLLLLLDIWPLGRWEWNHRQIWVLVREKLPLLGLAMVASLVTFLVQQHAGAVAVLERLPLSNRMLNAAISYLRYLGQMIWPVNLGVMYPLPRVVDPLIGVVCGVVIALISVVACAWVRRRPYFFTGWFWYVGTLVPVIGIVQVGQQSHADRYTYIPLIGVFIAIVWGIGEWLERRQRLKTAALAGALVLIAALAARAWVQTSYWHDSVTLFNRTLAVAPQNPQVHYNLGTVYWELGDHEEALRQYRESVRLQPENVEAWCNLALTLAADRRVQEASEVAEEAIRRNPSSPDVYNAKALVAVRRGDLDGATQSAEEVLRRDPGSPRAHLVLGEVCAARRQLDEAAEHFKRAMDSEVAGNAHAQLGLVLAWQGKTAEAEAQFREALAIQPNDPVAHEGLAKAIAAQGRFREAHDEFAAAVKADPTLMDARMQMGRMLALQGKTDEAIAFFRDAVARNANDAPAYFQLGVLLQQKHDAAGAIENYRRALALNPKSSARNNLAWILATSKNDQLRNGAQAVALAEQLRRERGDEPEVLDTLAAALAEKGEFDRAAQVAEDAAQRAEALKNPALATEIRGRLKLYRGKSAFRE